MQQKGLVTLAEWERLAAIGLVREPDYSTGYPATGIECPNFSGLRGEPCRSHLYDLPFFIERHGKRRRMVVCETCLWRGDRALGRKDI